MNECIVNLQHATLHAFALSRHNKHDSFCNAQPQGLQVQSIPPVGIVISIATKQLA